MTTLPCQRASRVVAVAFVVVCVVVVAVSMQIQQTVTKCATLSALILDSDAHETRLSPAFHFIFHISFFFLHLLCCFLFFSLSVSLLFSCFLFAKFPGRVSLTARRVRVFLSVVNAAKPKRVTRNIRFFFHISACPLSLSLSALVFPLFSLCVCVFLHISHGGQVKNSVICSTASQLATNATRS